MRLFFCILVGMTTLAYAQPLYQSDAFTLWPDRVEQGPYRAEALSRTHLCSDYQPAPDARYSRLITFKLAINGQDNEAAPGQDHWLLIGAERESPVIRFGETTEPPASVEGEFLPPNTRYTFRFDLAPVFEQFARQGYFEAYDGSRIAEEDFAGVYLAGGSAPLSWDFATLREQGPKLHPTGEGHIYAITLTLNPSQAQPERHWQPALDLSGKPQYQSEQPIVDALFNLSLEEALRNIEPDSTLRTGAKWGGVWTRDISYSIWLAFAYHEPEIARISLMKKVRRGRIVQDTGSGGAWPVSSDRTTWALAAWELFKVTGDRAWLRQAHDILQATLADDAWVLTTPDSALRRGESSFLDWREQSYPRWMDNADIYLSQTLGTNVVHAQAHRILGRMAEQLGEASQAHHAEAERIERAINQHLWLADRGYYAQFGYGRQHQIVSPRFEALGEALAILFDVADPARARRIVAASPLTPFGTTCLYPQIPGIPPYHNHGIWPFVQAYWNLAAAKAGNEAALNHGLAAIYRAGALFLTNYENMVAETGDYAGTEINSHRMLWSMAGNLAMVHRVFMGMHFEVEGLRLAPVVPGAYAGRKQLRNFRYRAMTLDLTVEGTGREIVGFWLDGERQAEPFVPGDLTGAHEVRIELAGVPLPGQAINLVPNRESLPTPQAAHTPAGLEWSPLAGAVHYRVYHHGERLTTTTDHRLAVEAPGEYLVSAVDSLGYESFASEPVWVGAEQVLPLAEAGGWVEISTESLRELPLTLTVEEAGQYWLDLRYANGSGPWNTDNKCALRSLYRGEQYLGTLVFPQRGQDAWADWGWSNGLPVQLQPGENTLRLVFAPWNENMNGTVNRARIGAVRWRRLR